MLLLYVGLLLIYWSEETQPTVFNIWSVLGIRFCEDFRPAAFADFTVHGDSPVGITACPAVIVRCGLNERPKITASQTKHLGKFCHFFAVANWWEVFEVLNPWQHKILQQLGANFHPGNESIANLSAQHMLVPVVLGFLLC